MIPKKEQLQLIQDIAQFEYDPLKFIKYAYPWGSGVLTGFNGAENWQRDLYTDINRDMVNSKNNRNRLHKYSVGSGHGIGKSASVGQICHWGLSTRENTKIMVTANTKEQLITKTIPEVQKWFRLGINSFWFDINTMNISVLGNKLYPNWRLDFLTWSEHNTEAFAGAHNQGGRLILIFDESSGIHDKVWEVANGAFTDANTDILMLCFGNRTKNKGEFSRTFKSPTFNSRCVDSRDVSFTNKEELEAQILEYGIDSDRIRIRILGMEPKNNVDQFISQVLIDEARYKTPINHEYNFAPTILSCDPAWSGGDEIVIAKRQGVKFEILECIPKNDNDILIAEKLARYEDEHNADAGFIDLGYGTGIYSALKMMNRKNWQLISFAEKSLQPGYLNKRAEMYGNGEQWLRDGGCIPNNQAFCDELSWIESYYRDDGKIQLVDKDEMKKEYGSSPNKADAWALTFARPVRIKEQNKPDLYKKRLEFSSSYNNYNVFS